MLRFVAARLAVACFLPSLLAACTSSSPGVGEADGSTTTSACAAAGGQCVLSDSVCAVPGPQACPSAAFAQFCCLQQQGSCGQPSVTTFSSECDAGPPSCQGTPARPELEGIPADAALGPEDPDASFGKGCTITYPVCGNMGVYTCTCGQGWDCKP